MERAAREALLEAIGRAQRRMAELSHRIAAMGTQVPGEFLNPGALGDTGQSGHRDQEQNLFGFGR